MSDDFPLYPALPEAGKEEAQALIEVFKKALIKAGEEALGKLYCDVIIHIESDSWTNYRNAIMDGFKDYDNRKIQREHDFKTIRQQIFKEFKDDIIKDLNQDLIEEVVELKKRYKELIEVRSS